MWTISRAPMKVVFAGALASAIALPALAEQPCGPRARIIDHLESKYGEAPSGTGIGSATSVVEVWTSAKSGTWTILVTRANGMSCILASGQDWHDVPLALMPPSEPA